MAAGPSSTVGPMNCPRRQPIWSTKPTAASDGSSRALPIRWSFCEPVPKQVQDGDEEDESPRTRPAATDTAICAFVTMCAVCTSAPGGVDQFCGVVSPSTRITTTVWSSVCSLSWTNCLTSPKRWSMSSWERICRLPARRMASATRSNP